MRVSAPNGYAAISDVRFENIHGERGDFGSFRRAQNRLQTISLMSCVLTPWRLWLLQRRWELEQVRDCGGDLR